MTFPANLKINAVGFLSIIWSAVLFWSPCGQSKDIESPHVLNNYYQAIANNVRSRRWSEEGILLRHFEIPLALIKSVRFQGMSDDPSLIIERDGQKFFRWIVHPEDTYIPNTIKQFLRDNKIPLTARSPVKYFRGYKSASRTLLVYDPELDRYFYLKPGTDNLNGSVRSDKDLSFAEAEVTVAMSEALAKRAQEITGSRHIHLIHETAAYGFSYDEELYNEKIEPGVIVRELPKLKKGEVLINVFSLLDSDLGKQIAADNGSEDPVKYWEKYLVKPLALAMAEFSIDYRAFVLNPHGQNLLLKAHQVGDRLVPTEHFYLHDHIDLVMEKIWLETEYFKTLDPSTQESITFATELDRRRPILRDSDKNGYLPIKFQPLGLLPRKTAPDWLTPEDYERWGEVFFEKLEKDLARLSGDKVRRAREMKKFKFGNQDFIREFIAAFDFKLLDKKFNVSAVNRCDLF